MGEIEMSATVYKWIIVYDGGYTEEKRGTCPYDFADDIIEVPIAIIRENAPELVRCKDCKHATMTGDGKMCKYCEIDTDDFGYPRCVYHDANWFCADGVKRNG